MDGHTDHSGQEPEEHGRPKHIWFVPGVVCLIIDHPNHIGPVDLAEVAREALSRHTIQTNAADPFFEDEILRGFEDYEDQRENDGPPDWQISTEHQDNRDVAERQYAEMQYVRLRDMTIIPNIPQALNQPLVRSMIRVDLNNVATSATLLRIVEPLNRPDTEEYKQWAQAWRAAWGSKGIPTSEAPAENDAAMQAAPRYTLPDWLMSSTPHNGTEGGPGTKPVSAEPAVANFEFPAFTPSATQGAGVTIFVLDSAPHGHDIGSNEHSQRVEQWFSTVQIDQTSQALLPADDSTPNKTALEQHNYDMSDHGLFIGYLLHTIAPKATVRIQQVLNKHCVGSLFALTQQLGRIQQEIIKQSGQPVNDNQPPQAKVRYVINCSLVLNIPSQDEIPDPVHPRESMSVMRLFDNHDDSGFDHSPGGVAAAVLEFCAAIVQAISLPEVVILAAAGNEGRNNRNPMARLIAAVPGVYGVGALESDIMIALYSSQADRVANGQALEGFLIFGGDADPSDGAVADSHRGLLGPYRGEVFEAGINRTQKNTTGWARWAGTSFATAIMSGLVATLAADHPARSRDGLMDFIRGKALQPSDPVLGGDRIACNVTYPRVP